MSPTIGIVGGSRDGAEVAATRPAGSEIAYAFSGSTGEVWLRDGDRLVLAPGAAFEDGVTNFEGEPS